MFTFIYSMRKHLVQKLMDEGVATNQIMEITGIF